MVRPLADPTLVVWPFDPHRDALIPVVYEIGSPKGVVGYGGPNHAPVAIPSGPVSVVVPYFDGRLLQWVFEAEPGNCYVLDAPERRQRDLRTPIPQLLGQAWSAGSLGAPTPTSGFDLHDAPYVEVEVTTGLRPQQQGDWSLGGQGMSVASALRKTPELFEVELPPGQQFPTLARFSSSGVDWFTALPVKAGRDATAEKSRCLLEYAPIDEMPPVRAYPDDYFAEMAMRYLEAGFPTHARMTAEYRLQNLLGRNHPIAELACLYVMLDTGGRPDWAIWEPLLESYSAEIADAAVLLAERKSRVGLHTVAANLLVEALRSLGVPVFTRVYGLAASRLRQYSAMASPQHPMFSQLNRRRGELCEIELDRLFRHFPVVDHDVPTTTIRTDPQRDLETQEGSDQPDDENPIRVPEGVAPERSKVRAGSH